MDLEYKLLPFEARATEADGSEFEGYTPCFHNIDANGDLIAPGAFAETLPGLLAEGVAA